MTNSAATLSSTARKGGRVAVVARRAQLGTSPALPHGGGPGKEARALVASAIEQRKRLLRTGRGHISSGALIQPMSFLQAWLDRTNDHVSAGSLRDFWAMHQNEVRLVMPGNKGGARTLETLQRLCS